MSKNKMCICDKSDKICDNCKKRIDRLYQHLHESISNLVLDMHDESGMTRNDIETIVKNDINSYMGLILMCLDED